jgi:hypothetical protein
MKATIDLCRMKNLIKTFIIAASLAIGVVGISWLTPVVEAGLQLKN